MQSVVSESEQQAEFAIIWMHGLGAGYEDMAGLAQGITWPNNKIRQIFLQAPDRPVTINSGMRMPAWYDIGGADLTHRQDCKSVHESTELIENVLNDQMSQGIKSEHLFLSGFSQGGAMALYTGLRLEQQLGGIVALSAYIPCVDKLVIKQNVLAPIFMGYGQFDPLLKPQWTQESHDYMRQKGFQNITLKSYPMEHAVCSDEVNDIQHWFSKQFAGENG